MEFITELSGVLALLPALIISLTSNVKRMTGKFTFVVPYVVGVAVMIGLYFTFNDQSIAMYIVNGVLFGYGASVAYDAGKKSNQKDFQNFDLEQ